MANPIVVGLLLAAGFGTLYWVSKKTAPKKKRKKKTAPSEEPIEQEPKIVATIPFQSGVDQMFNINTGDVVIVTYDVNAEAQPFIKTIPERIVFAKEPALGSISFWTKGPGTSPVVLEERNHPFGPPVGEPMRLFMEVI